MVMFVRSENPVTLLIRFVTGALLMIEDMRNDSIIRPLKKIYIVNKNSNTIKFEKKNGNVTPK